MLSGLASIPTCESTSVTPRATALVGDRQMRLADADICKTQRPGPESQRGLRLVSMFRRAANGRSILPLSAGSGACAGRTLYSRNRSLEIPQAPYIDASISKLLYIPRREGVIRGSSRGMARGRSHVPYHWHPKRAAPSLTPLTRVPEPKPRYARGTSG